MSGACNDSKPQREVQWILLSGRSRSIRDWSIISSSHGKVKHFWPYLPTVFGVVGEGLFLYDRRMERISISDASCIEMTIRVLRGGGAVVAPTDTVYGLIADAMNPDAISTINRIKKRDSKNPLGIFVSDRAMLERYITADSKLLDKLFSIWPGALTAVFNSNGVLKNFGSTIGIRVPAYEFLQKVIALLACPLVQTSANISGQRAFTKIADVVADLGEREDIDIIVDAGDLPDTIASTVVNVTVSPPKVLREGAISKKDFFTVYER